MQFDITGLAIIRPHRSSPDRVRQRTPKVGGAMTSLDPRWGRSIRALAMSSLNNSSKPMTSHGRVWLGLTGHGCQAPNSVLEHDVTRAGGSWDALTDLSSERQLESEISLTEAAIAASLAISLNSKMLEKSASSSRSPNRPSRGSLAVPQEVHQSTKSSRSRKSR